MGWELAGIVEKLGADTEQFKPGDAVFGMIALSGDGADAEFAVGEENALAIKPESLDFPGAAAIPIGALHALSRQPLRRRRGRRLRGASVRN